MDTQRIEKELGDVLEENGLRENVFGEYHPSEVSGCPLQVFLDYQADKEDDGDTLNHWLFSGSAVHHYLQETGLLSKALHNVGYHELETEYEVPTKKRIEPGVYITGTCDVLAHDGDKTAIMDIKYSSVNPSTQPQRMFKYFTQVNTYSHMFGADEHALIIINNRADNVPRSINVIDGEPSEDNWEKVKDRAKAIHHSLVAAGYNEGNRWDWEDLRDKTKSFWKDVVEPFPEESMPTYDRECNYCEHEEICPVVNGKLGGVGSFAGGSDD